MKIFKIIILGTALVASSAAFADLMPEGQTLAQIASAAEPEGQTPAQIAAYPESNPGSGRVITGIDPLSRQMSLLLAKGRL